MLYEHAIGDFPSGSFYHADFTEWDGGQFDVILMNPPYERSQDALHLLKAWEHLAPGGRLVALVSPSLPTRQNADTREAAMLIDDAADICEPLPTGCFKSSGTGVTPLLIKLRKPDLDVAERRKDRWARKV